jgi:lysine-specific permease
MIAIGGAIGTGLFLASGGNIVKIGPGGALLGYLIIGIMIYFIMTSLGEMATFMPVAGSFEAYGTRFVDPAFGYAVGWNYWLTWALTIPAELTAGALYMGYWFPHVPAWIWSVSFLVILFLLNIISVKGYGEAEFWFAGIKVITVIAFIITGILMIFGVFTGKATDFTIFNTGGSPFHGKVSDWFLALLVVGFAFQGTELVGIAAGESSDPDKNVPKAIKSVFWRILLFYVFAIFIIGMLVPYTDHHLLNSGGDVAYSPFTILFQRAGLASAAAVVNAVMLTAVLSAGNSSIYASSRMLWALAKSGKAPKVFAKVAKNGVPLNAVYLTTIIGFISFLSYVKSTNQLFNDLLYVTSSTGFINWLGISISHYRFRKAMKAQGKNVSELTYRSKFFPFSAIFSFVLCLVILIMCDWGDTQWDTLLSSYIGIPIFVALWLGYKMKYKTKMIPLKEVDLKKQSLDQEYGLTDRVS